MNDARVEIRGLRCRGRQGTTEAERAIEHEYFVDVTITADLSRAMASDDLTDAVDISAIAETVRASVAERPRALVERITADVARAILARFPQVKDVRARVVKPHPAGLDAEAEAVELYLAR